MEFKNWLENTEMEDLEPIVANIKNYVLRSMQVEKGIVSFRFPDFNTHARIQQPMVLAASTLYSGNNLIEGWEKEGGKGVVATQAIAGSIGHWRPDQRSQFEKAMSGKNSLPARVGKEMGLLFEIEAFIYLLNKYKLQPISDKNLQYALTEQQRLQQLILGKLRNEKLASLVVEFIQIHAGGPPHGMAELMYQKTIQLIGKTCNVNAIEFMGGEGHGGEAYDRIRKDTADIRIGCDTFMPGQRSDIGFSMKAGTESEMHIKSLSTMRAVKLLGGKNWKTIAKRLKAQLDNPLFEDQEKKTAVIQTLGGLAQNLVGNRPKMFVKLLEMLLTGGRDTLPAARQLVRNLGGAGWSGALGMDFVTSDKEGRKLGPRLAANPEIIIGANNTYMFINYRLPKGGTNYGTTLKFEPSTDLTIIDVGVNNLTALGGRGY